MMKTSAAGRAALMQREGVVLKAYRDSVGVLTIGAGHTSAAGAPVVTAGLTITRDEADAILSRDLATFEAAVNGAVKVPISQNEFDAMVSLAFNIGAGSFAHSSVVRCLNAGDRPAAADAFLMWRNAGGKPILLSRRQAERKQFLDHGATPAAPIAPIPPKPAIIVTDQPIPKGFWARLWTGLKAAFSKGS